MTDNAIASLNNSEEVLLGMDLGVVSMAEGDPTAALLRHLLHLLEPPLPEHLYVVSVEPIQCRDLIIYLILDRLHHRQHLLLQYLFRHPKKTEKKTMNCVLIYEAI